MAAIAEVVFLDIDCEKGDGPELAKRYGIRGYPTYLMVNPEGVITDAWIGYPGPEKWAEFARAGAADRRTIPEKKAAYETGPTLELARSLANAASTKSEYRDAVTYFRAAREKDPESADDYTQEILYSLYYGAREKVFTADEVTTEVDVAFADADPAEQVDLAGLVTAVAAGMEQPGLAVPYIEQALAASEGTEDEEVAASRVELQIEHALIAENDKEKALALKKSTLDENWKDDLRGVNRFAYWCFENEVNLAEAEALVREGIELAGDDETMRNRFLNTAAELAHLGGRNTEAVAYMKRVLETDPDRGYFQRQLVRFEEALNGDGAPED